MAYASVLMHEIVDYAVNHKWSIPEFQRGFVWKATQVRDLAESLWLNYPIGSLLMWNSPEKVEERVGSDAQRPSLWVVDGQQRATALCILFGRRPYWWSSAEDWKKITQKYDIRFDIHTKEEPYFWVADAAIRKVSEKRYIPLSYLLTLDLQKEQDQQKLQTLAREIKQQGFCDGMDAMEVYTRLDRVRKIRDKDIAMITIDQELEDVVEIFARLNRRGTRVTEADVYLGVVAGRAPGWVRDTFLKYLDDLKDVGFDLNPNLLFRTLTGVGAKKIRFSEIPDKFWNQESIVPAWKRNTDAWGKLVKRFKEYGILSNDPMPTEAALVTLVSLIDKFPDDAFNPMLYWFLQASRYGRYSGSGTTSLEEDLRDISEAVTLPNAIEKLLKRIPLIAPLEASDFMRDYADSRFGRFLLYLLAFRNKAQDWDKAGDRIGFDKAEVLADFRPQWHHIFPQKYLRGKFAEDKINALANIAVIGPSINIRINAKAPMDYIERYEITLEKRKQQYIDKEIATMDVKQFPDWLDSRAQKLADAGNKWLNELKGDF